MALGCQPGVCSNSSCISFFHSGGGGNCDPCMDLGGAISTCQITSDQLENLFHNIGPNLTRLGHTDYRCFYIMNTSIIESIQNAIVYMDGTGRGSPGLRGGTDHAIGVKLENAVQQVVVMGTQPNEGEYFECIVSGPVFPYTPQFKVYYDPNITIWTGNFQTAIRTCQGLQEVVVTSQGIVPNVIFTINYGGHSTRNEGTKGSNFHSKWDSASNHFINLIEIMTNTLSGCTVTPVPVSMGSPVNTTAEMISNEPVPPMNQSPPMSVNFDYYFRGNPIRIGNLRPQEYVPIWIRRTLAAPMPTSGALAGNTHTAKLMEYFTIKIEGSYP
jgi:hypothetical protein